MDLLSSYDDETSNNEQIASGKATSDTPQSEWENFEKSIEHSTLPDSSDVSNSESSKLDELNNHRSNTDKLPKTDLVLENVDDEDESHLPPGVRKRNRCHSSSSEDEEKKDKEKDHSDSDTSCSDDSEASLNRAQISKKKIESKDTERPTPKRETQDGHTKKARHSSSLSRSRSRSPQRKKRSYDRRSRSRSRNRRFSRDSRHKSHHSDSKERTRMKERPHYWPREARHKRSQSRERRRSEREQRSKRSRSREKSKRSQSRERSPSVEKRKRSQSVERSKRSHSRETNKKGHNAERSKRSQSMEKSESRDMIKRSRSTEKSKRSQSRERRKRSRSKEKREKRKRSRSREKSRRSRSRERSRRSRSRSTSPRDVRVIKHGDRSIKIGASFGRPPPSKPMTFKEKMRQQLIKAMEEGSDVSQAFTDKDGMAMCTQTAGTQQTAASKMAPVPLMANLVPPPGGLPAATITASEAAVQSMLALQKEATEKTGVAIPKYYNPAAINPMKYAEQVQKRKLLWSKTKDKDVNSQWNTTNLSSDHDDKSKEKFRKLMGIKQESGGSATGTEDIVSEEQDLKQKELFEKLDKEYQFARMATHTHRGVGLGFGSSNYQPPTNDM